MYRKKLLNPLTAHTTVAMYARREMSFFLHVGSSYSSVLCPILQKLHILTRLIESFPTLYSLWSGIEKEMSIPLLKIVNGKRFKRRNFLVLRPLLLQNAYLSLANRELSQEVHLVELR